MSAESALSTIRLYTPAMLAELIGVPVSRIRNWHRRGLLRAEHEVRRLPYFDFREVATARRIVEWLQAGISSKALGRQLDALQRAWPAMQRPLAELSIVLDGKRLLVRHPDGLAAPDGQLWFDFDEEDAPVTHIDLAAARQAWTQPAQAGAAPATVDELLRAAADLEDEGQLEPAADLYRAALAAAGSNAEICFLLAELLYRLGDLPGARERYFMAIELDENYVEARANLGCVLAELGQKELAIAAFSGALACHADYADAHFHLARTLDELGREGDAESHWKAFLTLAPDSPWADEAQHRLRSV